MEISHRASDRRRRKAPRAGSPSRRRRRALLLVLAVLLLAAAFGLAWTLMARRGAVPATVPLRTGRLEHIADADAWLVRTERVHRAPEPATVVRLAKDGERVRAGTPILETVPAGRGPSLQVQAEEAGLVLYLTDGLEDDLSPAAAGLWQPGWLKALQALAPEATVQGPAVAGAPLFKIVDNLHSGLLALVDAGALPPETRQGSSLELRFTGRAGPPHTGKVARVERDGGQAMLYITSESIPDELTRVRRARVRLVFASQTGMVAPRTAVDVRGGRQGVWVLVAAGSPVFVPAAVTGGNRDEVVLEGPLEPGAAVLRAAPRHQD